MKRYVLIAASIITFLVIITNPAVIAEAVQFFFLGLIPGTNIIIPFWIMLPGSLVIAAASIHWLRIQPLFIGSIPSQEQTARQLARKRIVPKKKIRQTVSAKRPFRPAKI